MTPFAEILDAASALPLDDQNSLLEILQRRIAERNRQQLGRDVAEARAEFAAGKATTASPREIMDEVGGET
jgi:hypothetical protein